MLCDRLRKSLLILQVEVSLQVQKEVAKREKERLRLQEKQRKANLEKMRLEQDQVATAGDVSLIKLNCASFDTVRGFML